MTAQIPILTPLQSAELTAFLRGLERRAAVFAELACGDPSRGDVALAAAMRAFRNAFARGPHADSALFWSLLLAAPQLRAPTVRGHWPAPLAGVAALGHGMRTAVLLRLLAGLDDAEAAAALRVPPATFGRAVQRAVAMPIDGARAAFWDEIARGVEHRVQHLPPERLVRLAAMRERAVNGTRTPMASRLIRRPHWRRPAVAATVVLCAVAFAATFLRGGSPAADPPIVTVALPVSGPPADTFDADTALLTHRDFEQVADARDSALVRDLDFYAWYAAQLATTSGTAAPLLLPDASKPLPNAPAGIPHASH